MERHGHGALDRRHPSRGDESVQPWRSTTTQVPRRLLVDFDNTLGGEGAPGIAAQVPMVESLILRREDSSTWGSGLQRRGRAPVELQSLPTLQLFQLWVKKTRSLLLALLREEQRIDAEGLREPSHLSARNTSRVVAPFKPPRRVDTSDAGQRTAFSTERNPAKRSKTVESGEDTGTVPLFPEACM